MYKVKKVNCVKCGSEYNGYMPALSRDDNITEVCPECGEREAGLKPVVGLNKLSLRTYEDQSRHHVTILDLYLSQLKKEE